MEKSTTSTLASTIKQLRLESGMSQEILSQKIRVSRTCLANYESGLRRPDFETILRIAEIFDVLADFLTGRRNERHLDLTEKELDDALRIKYILKEYGAKLDLSKLSAENKTHFLHYYHFLKNKNPLS